ncbi:MAG: hypothetical protein JWQ19_3768 [Subtercola sp.]|nr:hypothetical protein [Subtercola sp.]
MTEFACEITEGPGAVWRVGFLPDMWAWTPWRYATDSGLFDGRWDDQEGQFRTLYMASSLLGCLLELLARFRPSSVVELALASIEDDDGTVASFPEAPAGSVGHGWLENRVCGEAVLFGRYCFITHSRSLAALQAEYPFSRHRVALSDVDTSLLKEARDRSLTRSIARFIYDARADTEGDLVDGIEFRSRYGDEIKMWAVFERSRDSVRSRYLTVAGMAAAVTENMPEVAEAFRRHGLRWAD